MSDKFKINNIQDWLALPLLIIPAVQSIEEKGVVYNVQKVGYFLADIEECHNAGIIDNAELSGDIPLPVIVIKEAGGELKQYRLPVELNNWVYDIIEAANHEKKSPFPCDVEFGSVNGRYYAEMGGVE